MSADDHGSASTYRNHGCRCRPCTNAHAAYMAAMKRNRVAKAAAGDPSVPHGRYTTYQNWGCRCGECLMASRRRGGNLPAGHRPSTRDVIAPVGRAQSWTETLAWFQAHGTTPLSSVAAAVGRRIVGGQLAPHPARGRGYPRWSDTFLDRLFPDQTCGVAP